ncbi:MAG: hypothetical protein ACYCVH_08555 [Ignavibacteriaceae bacterium]
MNIYTENFNLTINIMKQLSGTPVSKNGLEFIQHENYEVAAILEVEL